MGTNEIIDLKQHTTIGAAGYKLLLVLSLILGRNRLAIGVQTSRLPFLSTTPGALSDSPPNILWLAMDINSRT